MRRITSTMMKARFLPVERVAPTMDIMLSVSLSSDEAVSAIIDTASNEEILAIVSSLLNAVDDGDLLDEWRKEYFKDYDA